MAIQPDGDRALFTNIDPDPGKRAEFWKLVEAHERAGGPDQMSCRFADRPEFWAKVVQQPNCPDALRDQHGRVDHARTIRFDIEAGDAMRAFLAGQDGWVTNRKRRPDESKAAFEARETPFVSFHDGRRGRTQYRIVGELPDEMSMAGRVQLLRNFSDEFRRRKIPFVAVMHAPDHNNDEKNWHFHLIYYDRPCARVTAGQVAELDREGYDATKIEVGMWDFAAVTNKRNRVNRPATPLQQKKVSEVGNDRWIGNLRQRFAAQTNALLEKERVERRVDPRRHADMGIPGDPQEHLGTRQAAAETRGIVTPIGRTNEDRQSRAILEIIDQKHEAEGVAIVRLVEAWRTRSQGRPAAASSSFATAVDELSDSLMTAAALDRLSAQLRHDVGRAGSRATHVRRTNDQLVRAIDADPAAGSTRERRDRARLVEEASDYLAWLGITLTDEQRLIATCEAEAKVRRTHAAIIEAQLAAAVSVEPSPMAMTPSSKPSVPDAGLGDSTRDTLERWITHVEVIRPYILRDRAGYTVVGDAGPAAGDPRIEARLAALHKRQQEDIRRIVDRLRTKPTTLSFRIVEGHRIYTISGVERDLAKAFVRYQDATEVTAAIHVALNPSRHTRAGLSSGVDLNRSRAPVEQRASLPPARSTVARPAVAAEPTASVPTKIEVEPVVPTRAKASPSTEFIAPIEPVKSSLERPVTDRAPRDPTKIGRGLIDANVLLTIANDHFVERAALRAAKVPEELIESVRRDQLLVLRTADQVEAALVRISAHATRHSEDFVRHDGRYSLGGKAPVELVDLAHFHANAPRVQHQLKLLYDALNPPIAEIVAVPDRRSPIERHPERFSTVEPDYAMRDEAKAYAREQEKARRDALERGQQESARQAIRQSPEPKKASADTDTLHGEAARQAAVRAAAAQRGSR